MTLPDFKAHLVLDLDALATPLLAQAEAPLEPKDHVINGVIFAVLFAVLVSIAWYTRKYFKEDQGQDPGGMVGFSLQELREMRDDGRLDPEEFARLKAMIVVQSRENYLAEPDDTDQPSAGGKASIATGNDLATHGLLADDEADGGPPPPEASPEPIDLEGDGDEEADQQADGRGRLDLPDESADEDQDRKPR